VVWRLAKALTYESCQDATHCYKFRLIIDNLTAFNAICPHVDPRQALQSLCIPPVEGITEPLSVLILAWDNDYTTMQQDNPTVVIETFACGIPDWYSLSFQNPANLQTRLHIQLDYLSAESWVKDVHLLPSLSSIPAIRKIRFMPGFNSPTGGLIHDLHFMRACAFWQTKIDSSPWNHRTSHIRCAIDSPLANARRNLLTSLGIPLTDKQTQSCWIPVFTYEHDYHPFFTALAQLPFEVLILLPDGRATPHVLQAWSDSIRKVSLVRLPFVSQESWDEILLSSDFPIIRGEESWARATLAGRAFLWQAYVQAEDHQLIKVKAFLKNILQACLPTETFLAYQELFLNLNQAYAPNIDPQSSTKWLKVLGTLPDTFIYFQELSKKTQEAGDCAQKLIQTILNFLYDSAE